MKRHFEKGASHVEIFAVVAVIALAGVLTFVYYNKSQELASKPATTKTPMPTASCADVRGGCACSTDAGSCSAIIGLLLATLFGSVISTTSAYPGLLKDRTGSAALHTNLRRTYP